MLRDLKCEAGEIVALEERAGIVYATGQTLNAYAGESVGLSGVSAEAQSAGVGGVANANVLCYVVGRVLVGARAAIPVVRDTLLASPPLERAWSACDAEEGLEVVPVLFSISDLSGDRRDK